MLYDSGFKLLIGTIIFMLSMTFIVATKSNENEYKIYEETCNNYKIIYKTKGEKMQIIYLEEMEE